MGFRVAVVQMDFEPAFYSEGHNYITERPLSEAVRASGRVGSKLLEDLRREAKGRNLKWSDWERVAYDAYLNHINKKVIKILDYCNSRGANLILFPEYSIPPEILPSIQERSDNSIIFAGTHSANRHHAKVYEAIGLDIEESDERRSICPVFIDGVVTRVDKMRASYFEPGLKPGSTWAPIYLAEAQHGLEGTLVCLICSDFLEPPREFDQKTREIADAKHLVYVIPAYTPAGKPVMNSNIAVLDHIDRRVKRTSKRALFLFANVAAYGGSRLYFHNLGDSPPMMSDALGYKPLPKTEEAILLCDLSQDEWVTQDTGFTSVGSAGFPFSEYEPVPLLFRNRTTETLEFLGTLHEADVSWDDEMASVLGACESDLPQLLAEKLRLLSGMLTPPHSESRRLTSYCDMGDLATTAEWRFQLTLGTWRVTRALVKEPGVSSETLQTLRTAGTSLEASARSLASSLGVRYFPEFAVKTYNPQDLMKDSIYHSIRVLKESSSGQVENKLAGMAVDIVRGGELGWQAVLSGICQGVSAMRPFPAMQLSSKLETLARNDDPEGIVALAEEYMNHRETESLCLVNHAIENSIPEAGDVILLYGFSENIVRLLTSLDESTRNSLSIIVAECPNRLGEDSGPAQARLLMSAGFSKIQFAPHPSIYQSLLRKGITRVLMGANYATSTEIVNTVGSRMVAEAAKSLEIPLVFMFPVSRFWSRQDLQALEIEDVMKRQRRPTWALGPGSDLGAASLPEKQVINYAYDVVPLDLPFGIITDQGFYTSAQFASAMERLTGEVV